MGPQFGGSTTDLDCFSSDQSYTYVYVAIQVKEWEYRDGIKIKGDKIGMPYKHSTVI